MISLVINGPTYQEAREKIKKAISDIDLLELRLDLFKQIDLDSIREIQILLKFHLFLL